jgi:hypothetical protein
MTAKQLKEWKKRYDNESAACFYINETVGELTDTKIDKKQLKYTETLATLMIAKDDALKIKSNYGKVYKWVWAFQKDLPEDDAEMDCKEHMKIEMSAMEKERNRTHQPITKGHTYHLKVSDCFSYGNAGDCRDCYQLLFCRVSEKLKAAGTWWNWLYLQPSELLAGRLGLFADRDFPKGSVIGFVCGEEVYAEDEEGKAKPEDSDSTEDTSLFHVRKVDGCWHGIAPGKLEFGDGKSVWCELVLTKWKYEK